MNSAAATSPRSSVLPALRSPASLTLLGLLSATLLAATGFTSNPALLAWTAIIAAFSLHILATQRVSIPLVIGALSLAGLIKRLLFVSTPVDRSEYFLAILLPDVVLGASFLVAARRLPLLKGPMPAIDKAMVLFLGYLVLEIFNPRVDLWVGMAGFKLTGLPVVAYLLGRFGGLHERSRAGIRNVVIALAVAATGYGLMEAVVGPPAFEISWMSSGLTGLTHNHRLGLNDEYRIMSTFESHEQFGFFLSLGLLLLATGKSGWLKGAALGAPILVALFLTYSRSSWTVLACGILGLAFFTLRPRWAWILGVALPAIAIIACSLLAHEVARHQFSMESSYLSRAVSTGTFSARADGWDTFWKDDRFWTLFGNGIGSLWAAASKFGRQGPVPHNGILQFVYELGWVGTALFVGVWVTLLLRLRSIPAAVSRSWESKLAFSFMLGVMVTNASVAEVFHLRQISLPFWLLAGMLASLTTPRPAPPGGPPERAAAVAESAVAVK